MKNAIILHGSGASPSSYWYPGIAAFLEKKGFEVWCPELPGSDNPDIDVQLPFVLENGRFAEETVIIAQSAGVPLALSVLERIDIKLDTVVLVAGFFRPLKKIDHGKILQRSYDWECIKDHTRRRIIIVSDDDPWGCGTTEGRGLQQEIGGTLMLLHGQGHMGSTEFDQPYKEFPLLERLFD